MQEVLSTARVSPLFIKNLGSRYEAIPYDKSLLQKDTLVAHIWSDPPPLKWYAGFITSLEKRNGGNLCIRCAGRSRRAVAARWGGTLLF
eukprot:scaffold502_cov115-Isochrysis_galbana.AAC.21